MLGYLLLIYVYISDTLRTQLGLHLCPLHGHKATSSTLKITFIHYRLSTNNTQHETKLTYCFPRLFTLPPATARHHTHSFYSFFKTPTRVHAHTRVFMEVKLHFNQLQNATNLRNGW